MIKVVIKVDESTKRISSLEVKGHANKAPYGKDLVCAAVSAVLTGGMNALDPNKCNLSLKEGHALIETTDTCGEYEQIVLNTIVTQLKTIEENDKKFVEIKIL